MFVHEDDFTKTKSIKDIKEDFQQKSDTWNSPYIAGEISELVAKKMNCFSKKDGAEVKNGTQAYLNLLKKVNNRNSKSNDYKFNIVAMEIFKAKATIDGFNHKLDTKNKGDIKEKLKLRNILHEKQLLYPVSFVVRKEDTVLRNFINLRIAELYERTPLKRNAEGNLICPDGIKSLIDIIKEEAKDEDGIKPNEIDNMFIQTYDFSNLASNSRD